MGRHAHPHLAAGKWRFRWSITALTEADCRAEVTRLRRLAPAEASQLKPMKTRRGYRLAWSVVRKSEADILQEYARYTQVGRKEVPETVARAASRWALELSPRHAWLISPAVEFAGDLLLADVSANWLERYKRWLTTYAPARQLGNQTIRQPYSYESQRQFVRAAGMLFRHAAAERWISTPPKAPHFPDTDPDPRAYTRQELADAYRSLHNVRCGHVLPMLRLMLETGLRLAEVRTLRWEYVRFADHALAVPARAHKGGKVSGKSRILPLTARAERILHAARGASSTWVFVSKRYGEPYTRDGLNSILYRGATKAAPGRTVITPHRLKHTFAQRAIDAGIPPHVVSEMLGHKDSKMVWVYARIKDEMIRDAYEQQARHARAPRPAEHQSGPAPASAAPSSRSARKGGRRSRGTLAQGA